VGRWAQRRRCGGGESINFMTEALSENAEDMLITYLLPVTVADFDRLDFKDNADEFPDEIHQVSANQLRGIWFASHANGTLTYSGDVPRVLNPQTIAITL
jgi:hypothetical protein